MSSCPDQLTSGFGAVKIGDNMQLFGTSGIRRVADKDLLQLALKVGLAVGKVHGNVIVGSDTRTSSEA